MANPSAKHVLRYGMNWPSDWHPADIEMECIRRKGRWRKKNGKLAGEGIFFHHKRLQQILDPTKVWHRWNDLLLQKFIDHRIIGVLGPASSGKTREAADFARMSYYIWPYETTIIVSSTERETLEDRVWGEIKAGHRAAFRIHPDLPGHLIESRQRLVTDDRDATDEQGLDMRSGIVGVPCKKGGSFTGVSAFAGRKNKRVILIADEGQFMPRAYVDAISNLNKNTDFKAIVLGNPKETTDALGIVCEPAAELGGWDGGVDQNPGTKTWPIRFPNGVCVQLVGSDSPNLDGKLGIPLITQEHIDADIQFYGKDSLQFTMMDEGRMPRGQGLRRVITRQMCMKFGAMEPPIWKSEKRVKIFFLDAAYGRVGGDRCVGGELQFGPGLDKDGKEQNILALIDTILVPVSASLPELPEDQIALFVKAQCEQRAIPPDCVFFDSTGRGSLMSAFARLWSPAVNGVEFGGKPSERQVSKEIDVTCREYYSKFVSELWYSVRLIIEACQFRGMTEDVMMEGCQREWGFVASNKIEVETKDDMKLKSGRSPDLFDALVAGVEGARRKGFVIERGGISGLLRNNLWKRELRERASKIRARYELNYSA
jgi:hypothetical protein